MCFLIEVYTMYWLTWIVLESLMNPVSLTHPISLMIWPCSSPPWKSIYIKDNERKEGFEDAEKLYFFIKKTYQKYNIPIVEIPFKARK